MIEPDDEAAAAEYVLGTLDEQERADFEQRRKTDPSLDVAVGDWERRLSPLAEGAPEIAPPSQVLSALRARLFGVSDGGADIVSWSDFRALESRLRRWRWATAACGLLAASMLAWIALVPLAKPDQKFVAVLQKDPNSPAILLDVDVAARQLTMRPVSAQTPENKAYELWLIDPSLGPPRSLGTLASNGITRSSLTRYDPGTIKGATYAVTLEPAGGSPTGAPSGPPVLVGKLIPQP